MPRNDPTDTGGLFIGRRPGTAPLKYRHDPVRDDRRERMDRMLAALLLALMILVVLTAWGPQPLAWLWVGSQVDYYSGSTMLGIATAFLGLLASLLVTLMITARMDSAWRLLRRAGGYEQTEGALGRIFMWTAIVAGGAFLFWFIIIEGPGPSIAPNA